MGFLLDKPRSAARNKPVYSLQSMYCLSLFLRYHLNICPFAYRLFIMSLFLIHRISLLTDFTGKYFYVCAPWITVLLRSNYARIALTPSRKLPMTCVIILREPQNPYLYQHQFIVSLSSSSLFHTQDDVVDASDADLACTHAKKRFNPATFPHDAIKDDLSDEDILTIFKKHWEGMHENMRRFMYFVVCISGF
jgi:hypothetical protein